MRTRSINRSLPWLSRARRLAAILRFEARVETAVIIIPLGPHIVVLRLVAPQLVDDAAE